MNRVPGLDKISRGIPSLEKITNSASETDIESIFCSGSASGNPVAWSIKVRIYLCPPSEGLSGPTRSIDTLENGSVMIGTLHMGTFLTLPLEENLWHLSQDLQKFLTSVPKDGQKKDSLILDSVFLCEKWPARVDSCATESTVFLQILGTTRDSFPMLGN